MMLVIIQEKERQYELLLTDCSTNMQMLSCSEPRQER